MLFRRGAWLVLCMTYFPGCGNQVTNLLSAHRSSPLLQADNELPANMPSHDLDVERAMQDLARVPADALGPSQMDEGYDGSDAFIAGDDELIAEEPSPVAGSYLSCGVIEALSLLGCSLEGDTSLRETRLQAQSTGIDGSWVPLQQVELGGTAVETGYEVFFTWANPGEAPDQVKISLATSDDSAQEFVLEASPDSEQAAKGGRRYAKVAVENQWLGQAASYAKAKKRQANGPSLQQGHGGERKQRRR